MPKLELRDDKFCFACGERNPAGLKLVFTLEGSCLKTQFTPQKIHQGYQDIVHGGIIGLVLDEVMINLLWKAGKPAVTAEIKLKLRKPAMVNQPLYFVGRIVEEGTRIIYTEGEARNAQGELVAQAHSKCAKVSNA